MNSKEKAAAPLHRERPQAKIPDLSVSKDIFIVKKGAVMKKEVYPTCPICKAECETVFYDEDYNIFGCDECVQQRDAWEVDECFPESED